MQFLRYILFPMVPIYCLVSYLRNALYDKGIFKSQAYDLPIICVGNLSTGGTGKSPMIEYLVGLLKDSFKLAIISRGYKRQTDGFILAEPPTTVEDIGDEPFQFHTKFPDVQIAVDGDRTNAINHLLSSNKKPEVILLDDGFQHRKVKAGLNIVLTSYENLYVDDICLPTGDLREPKRGIKRAQMVVVTKCPTNLSESDKSKLAQRLNLESHQDLYFSNIKYAAEITNEQGAVSLESIKGRPFTLVTGIANPQPLVTHLNDLGLQFEHLEYSDHHNFSTTELKVLNEKSMLLTTEKDYVRLQHKLEGDKLYYLPIEVEVDKPEEFNAKLIGFCNDYSIGAAEL